MSTHGGLPRKELEAIRKPTKLLVTGGEDPHDPAAAWGPSQGPCHPRPSRFESRLGAPGLKRRPFLGEMATCTLV
jgi:hypothetical protein